MQQANNQPLTRKEIIFRLAFVFGVVVLILTGILVGSSVKNVNQDEWALNYGRTTRHIRGNVIGPGRAVFQPDTKLITYKNTFVPWDLNIDCWTRDGLEVSLEIAIQTRYVETELKDILFEFGTEQEFAPYVTNVLKKIMRETCSNYTSFEYYSQRGIIQNDMLASIDVQLPTLGTHITTGGFLQLKNIALPAQFNDAILDRRSAEQDIQVAENKRAQEIIIATTNLNQAVNHGIVAINNANFLSESINYDATQQAIATLKKYQERISVYTTAMLHLNQNASSYIHDVLYPQLIARTGGTTVVFG